MMSNFIGRRAALLCLAFFLTGLSTAFSQTVTTLSAGKIEELVSYGQAGILRSHLLGVLKGKVERNNVAERITITGNGETLTCDIISIAISLKTEKAELVCLRFTNGAKVKEINLVQYANGELAELQGNDLVTYSHTKEVKACAGGSGAGCSGCASAGNAALARSAGVAQKVSAFFKAAKANCLGCFGDLDDVIECITGHNP